jgi:integrase/recombinase XerD
MTKVSLYVRKAGKGYKLAKPQQAPLDDGQSYVLRYAGTWETLKDVRTYFEAAAAATAKRLAFITGKAVLPEPKPRIQAPDALDVLLDQYLTETESLKSHKTWLAYKLTLTDFVRSCGCQTVDQITQATLKAFAMRMKRAGLGDRSISNRLVHVVTFLRAHGVEGISLSHRYTEKKVSAYTNEELTNLFSACNEEEKLMFRFFLQTGFREQEVMVACYTDLNPETKTIMVLEKPEFEFKPKDSEERQIPIPDALVAALLERRKHTDSKLIFPNGGGRTNGHMLRDLLNIAKRAGLHGKFGLHKFRKSFATMHHDAGVSARTIQAWLGHSDLATTLAYLGISDMKSARTRQQVNNTFAAVV